MRKKLTLFFALLCASMMSWADTKYCETPIADGKILYTCAKVDATTYTVILAGTSTYTITGCNNSNWGINDINGVAGGSPLSFGYSEAGYGSLTATFKCATTPNKPYVAYIAIATNQGQVEINECPKDMDWTISCSGGASCDDSQKPSVTDVNVGDIAYNSAVLTITAKDNIGVTRYVVKNGDVQLAQGTSNVITLDNLAPATSYDNIKVYAYDACNNESDVFNVASFTTDSRSYCRFATGHLSDPKFGDINGRILLTIKKVNGTTIAVKVEPNNNGTKGIKYLNIIVDGVDHEYGNNDGSGEDLTGFFEISELTDLDFTFQLKFYCNTPNWTTNPFNVTESELCAEESIILTEGSEYCGDYGVECDRHNGAYAYLKWETTEDGDVVISMVDGVGSTNARFRGNNGMGENLNGFTVLSGNEFGTSEAASKYFTRVYAADGNTFTLQRKGDVVLPSPAKIRFASPALEWSCTQDVDGYAWPTYVYTYGKTCPVMSGYAVSASVNNNTMGSAVAKVGDDEVTSVEENTAVTFIATSADPALYSFVNWTKAGVEVSTDLSYTTTITETTNLVANFDYIRETYCHTAVQTTGNKKLYLTVGKGATEGTYQIKIYGSDELTITGINNANTAMNVIKFSTYDGNDVPLNITNKGWEFFDTGYGMITSAEIRPQTGHTWREMWMWRPDLYIGTNAGEQNINSILSQQHHFNWDNECSDTEAPVFDKAEAEVLNESSVRLKIQATDNWGGLLTYTITRAGADDIILKGASGEELTQEITGLTKGTKYTFTVSVTDGVKTATSPSIEITPVGDEEKPEMLYAWLVSKTWNSAIINVGAKDNKGVKAIRVINADPAIDVEYVAVEGEQTNTKITVTGLTANTAYSFTITAKDAAGNESASKEVVAFTTDAHLLAPTTAAPDPTWPDDQVISFYSDKYTEPTTWNYRAPWGGSTGYEQVVIAENNVIHYSSFDWAGWVISSGNPYNALMMEKLHLDIWVENDCEIGIIPIYGGDGLSTDDTHRVKRALLGQRWNSIDLVLATDYAELNLASIFQFKFDQATTTEFYLDNVYFYRESAIVDDDAPYNVSGNMASQSYFSVTLALSAKDNSGAVTYIIEHGGTQVASTSGASDATVNVKIDNLASGTDYVFSVIAKDERDNAADAIDVNASTLAAPAPAPTPTHVAAAVKSLYSNAYTPVVAVENYSEWWWQSPTVHTNHVLGADDNVLFYDNNHAAGASFGWSWSVDNKIDFSGYQKLHMHIYPTTSGTIEIYPVIAPEGEFHKVSQNLIAGQWNEIVLDYTEKTFAPLNQIGFINFYNLGDFFIDNVYFWKEPDYTRDDSWMAPGELGTVCYQEGLIVTGATMYQMAGTDANGKFVFDEVDVLSPGVPYLFEATANTIQFYATPATPATEAGKSNGMVGTFSEKIIPQNSPNIYYFSGKKFYAVTARQTDLTVPANRAYVDLTTPQPATAPKPGVRRITFDVEGTNTTTGVDQLNASDAPVKTIINGHLFILRGDKMYDATGRMVK